MTITVVQTNLPDVNQKKWKWSALGSTVAGASIGDWALTADLADRTVVTGGTFGTTLAAVTWQGSINGNTSDAVAFTLTTIAGVAAVASTATTFSIGQGTEYIRPIISVASTLSAIDAYLFGRTDPR